MEGCPIGASGKEDGRYVGTDECDGRDEDDGRDEGIDDGGATGYEGCGARIDGIREAESGVRVGAGGGDDGGEVGTIEWR